MLEIDLFTGRPTVKRVKKETIVQQMSGGGSSSAGSSYSLAIGNSLTGGTNNRLLKIGSGDVLAETSWESSTASLLGGAVPSLYLENKTFTSPRLESLDLSGFGVPNALAFSINGGSGNLFFFDRASGSSYFQVLADTATPGNSTLAFSADGGVTRDFSVGHTGAALTVPIDMNNNKITELATPTATTDASTKAYVDDRVSDTAYGAGWDGVTDVAPSKNAVYDKIATLPSVPGSNTEIVFNDGGSLGTDSIFTYVKANNQIYFPNSGVEGGILMDDVSKNSYVAVGPQGNYGPAWARNEPHIAINTVRISADGSNVMTLRNGANSNNVYLRAFAAAFNQYATSDNQVDGFYLQENGSNNASMTSFGATQNIFSPVAKVFIQAESNLIGATAGADTLRVKAQTSQTGRLIRGVNTSNAEKFGVSQGGSVGIGGAPTSTSPLNITGLPTSSSGLATGDVWSNSGVLTIV